MGHRLVGASGAIQVEGGGVAFAARVGGCVSGALLVNVFRNRASWARHDKLLFST